LWYSPFVRIVDILQTDILFILEQTVELGMMAVEAQFREKKRSVRLDERSITLHAIANCPAARLNPPGLLVGVFECLVISASPIPEAVVIDRLIDHSPQGDPLAVVCAPQSTP
jgi:hypothetical protein